MTQKKLQKDSAYSHMDKNNDNILCDNEIAMALEFKRKELEDADAMRDAQRKMAWFALYGMLLYPAMVVLCVVFGIDQASKTLGDMAPTYFVSVAAIVAAFYGKSALENKK